MNSQDLLEPQEQPSSDHEHIKTSRQRKVYIEPAVLLLFYAWNVSSSVFTNQVIFQSCTAAFGVNQTECAYLGTNNETDEVQMLEQLVQPYAANIVMTRTLIESIIPAIVSLFIGPWSDIYGRKPVMLSTFSGYFLTYSTFSIICFVSQYVLVNPWWYIIAFFPAAISGGNCALITGVFAYIADVTTHKNRAVKMGILEAMLYCGLVLGSFSSSYILKWTSAASVFLIATLVILLGLAYIIFFIEESVVIHNELHEGSKYRNLFKTQLVRDLFRASCKRRPNYDRLIMWLTISTLGLMLFAMQGSGTVFFMFVRKKFEWTLKDFSFLESSSIIIQIVGSLLGLFIGKRLLNLSDTVMGLIAIFSLMINSGIIAMASKPVHLYYAVALTLLRGLAGPMSRAVLSTVIPKEDIGKVFSLTTSIESITGLIAAPLYTLVYENTLQFYPGAFNIISMGAHFGCFAFLTVVYILQNMYQNVAYTSIN